MEMEGKYESVVVHSPKQWITSQLPSAVWTIQKACVDHAFTIKVLIKISAEKGKNQINHWQYRFHIPKGSGFKCMSDQNLQALNNLESRKYNKKWRIWNCNPKCTGFFYVSLQSAVMDHMKCIWLCIKIFFFLLCLPCCLINLKEKGKTRGPSGSLHDPASLWA